MNVLKCEMCGDNIKISPNQTFGTCESCDTVIYFPKSDSDEKSDALLRRGYIFLEDKNWDKAAEYFDKVLDLEPECAQAYIGVMCVELRCAKQELLAQQNTPIDENANYKKVMRFGNAEEQEFLRAISASILGCISKKCIDKDALIGQNNLHPIVVGENIVIGLRTDGTVVAAGKKGYYESEVSNLRDIISVSAEIIKTLALRSDGTVVSIGGRDGKEHTVEGWSDIVSISAAGFHTAALRADGTVMEVVTKIFSDEDVQNVYDVTDTVAIAAGYDHIVCVQADGSALSVGKQTEIFEWTDIVSVAAGYNYSVGLRRDGTVVASGQNDYGEGDVDGWTDIVAVTAGGEPFTNHTVGLRSDGTVVATGKNKYGQCDVSGWRNIVAISAGIWQTAGLRADGTVLLAGRKKKNIYDALQWTNIGHVL